MIVPNVGEGYMHPAAYGIRGWRSDINPQDFNRFTPDGIAANWRPLSEGDGLFW